MAIIRAPVNLSTLILLPILCLISVPLVICAWFTICFSVLALSVRVLIIYAQICYALVSSYFVISTSPNLSLLTFSSSEPPSPVLRARPPSSRPAQPRRRSSTPGIMTWSADSVIHDGDGISQRPTIVGRSRSVITLRPSALLTFVSGDEGRDFEGVGGWRYYGGWPWEPAFNGNGTEDDADERSWLFNNRLELPSQRRLSLVMDDLYNRGSAISSSAPVSSTPTPTPPRRHRRAATMFAHSSSGRRWPTMSIAAN